MSRMKAILEFNIPEDNEEFNHAVKSADYYVCLFDFYQYLRTQLKYDEQLSDIERDTFKRIREEFNGILTENKIEL
jgi:hypothetical protein